MIVPCVQYSYDYKKEEDVPPSIILSDGVISAIAWSNVFDLTYDKAAVLNSDEMKVCREQERKLVGKFTRDEITGSVELDYSFQTISLKCLFYSQISALAEKGNVMVLVSVDTGKDECSSDVKTLPEIPCERIGECQHMFYGKDIVHHVGRILLNLIFKNSILNQKSVKVTWKEFSPERKEIKKRRLR